MVREREGEREREIEREGGEKEKEIIIKNEKKNGYKKSGKKRKKTGVRTKIEIDQVVCTEAENRDKAERK